MYVYHITRLVCYDDGWALLYFHFPQNVGGQLFPISLGLRQDLAAELMSQKRVQLTTQDFEGDVRLRWNLKFNFAVDEQRIWNKLKTQLVSDEKDEYCVNYFEIWFAAE